MGVLARRATRAGLAGGIAAALVAAGIAIAPGTASAHARTRKFVPPKVQQVKVLPRKLERIPDAGAHARARIDRAVAAELTAGKQRRPDSAWPVAGSSVAVLPRPAATTASAAEVRASLAPVAAGRLPVTVARTSGKEGNATRIGVSILGRGSAAAAHVAGLVMKLTEPGRASGPVRVSVNYRSFANASGGDFGQRLRLVGLPACALTTPRVPACQVQTPLRSVNDGRSEQVSAVVGLTPASGPGAASLFPAAHLQGLAAAASNTQAVVAAVAGPSGSSGDFTAATLQPAGTWSAGGSSGDFTWSYPITVPPPAAGSAPQVSLDYNSASVDGETAQTDNQDSMVGEGFSLEDNYIERSYVPCAFDPEGAVSDDYDQCWAGNVVTLSLDGKSTPLVLDSSTGTWHEEQDSGDEVQYLTGTDADTGNGTYDNGYWVVTTADGTQYYFGKNKGPGWASGDPVTNSAWTEPVYGADSGDPCYSSSGFAESSCSQAWRWNLDFVIDPNGNATAYYYDVETNYYGADNQTTGVEYDRAGYLTQIDYGLRDENGSIYTGINANPPDEVVFGADQRCIPTSTFSCAASDFTAANASYWPDTPQDQQCLAGATCNNHAPTFWSQMRIDSITTQYYNGSGYTEVDSYALGQSFPTAGDTSLQLDTITRTGYTASGSSITLPPVDLSYQLMDNRVPGYNSEPSMAAWRLTNLETETGEVIDVTYSSTCTTADIPSSPSSNTSLCYPIMWTPLGDASPILDYFNKYVVDEVSVEDGTTGDPSQVTEYEYVGNPAWHYDDNQLVKAADRTYGQFRGYGTVDVLTGNPQNDTDGAPDVQTLTETTYYQGMDDDTLPGGGTSTASVTDSLGESFTDSDALAGLPLEVQTFNGSTGAQLTDKITEQSVLQVTANEPVSGLPTVQATMTGVTSERDFTDLPGGGQNELITDTTYDSDGRPVLVQKSGTSIPTTCTQTTYDDNTSPGVWIRDAVSETIVAHQACPSGVGELTASDIVSDIRTFYDGNNTSLTAPPTAGNPTMETEAVSNDDGALTFATQWTKTYDSSGRIITDTDGRGNTTTMAYTPADGGPLTAMSIADALGYTSTETFDPGRGSVLTSTDTAGYETSAAYDALGRLVAVWKPGRSQSSGVSANVTYSYSETQTKPLAVTTNTLVDYGTGTDYQTSISIYDSLGQLRETQTAAEGGDTVVSDNFYDSHGWLSQTYSKYVVTGNPSSTLVSEAASAVNDRTVTTYNGAGQVIDQQDYNGDTLTDYTQTVQGADQVTTIDRDPSGDVIGTPSATVTNVLGEQTETIQYAGAPTVSSSSVVGGGEPQITTMSYDAMGNETSTTDPAGNVWSYSYNLLGQQIKAVDPDTGATVTGYDAAGNVAYTTDADGTSVNYTYDALNRKTAEYTGSTTQGDGTKVATWVYDTEEKGYPSYETSITGSGTYTTGNLGYDSYGNVDGTFVTVPSGQPLAGTYKTKYTYSSTGLLLTESPPTAGGLPVDDISWTYDQYGNPIKEQGYDTYVSGADYTPYNEISQIDLGTGSSAAALTYSYDPQTRAVTGVNLSDDQPAPQVDNTTYSYNADQQITSVTDTQGSSGTGSVETQCFDYDGLSRVTEAWSSTDACAEDPASDGNSTVGGPEPYWQSWTYDELGDILTQTDYAPSGSSAGNDTTSYSYGVSGHAHAIAATTTTNSVTGDTSTTSYGYDADGNTTTLGSQSLTWNYNGTLASAGNTSYIYDADGNELAETTPSGTTLYLPGEQLTQTSSGTTGMRYYTFDGKMIAETNGSTLYWTEANLQGSLTVAVNAFSESSPVTYRTFTPYGAVVGSDGTWPDNRTFLNDPYNAGTGLVDIGARKFDPTTDTFISVDPDLTTSNPLTLAGYTYAVDDPVNAQDPSGMMFCDGGSYCGGGVGQSSNGTPTVSGGPAPGTAADNTGPGSPFQILNTPVKTVFGTHLPPGFLQDMQQFLYYHGSDNFTVSDMATWLLQNMNKPWSDQVWLAFCEGLAGLSVSRCARDPLNGEDMSAGPSLGKTLASIGLVAAGMLAGTACEAAIGETGVGTVACAVGTQTLIGAASAALAPPDQWGRGADIGIGAFLGMLSGGIGELPDVLEANGVEIANLSKFGINVGGTAITTYAGYQISNFGYLSPFGAGASSLAGEAQAVGPPTLEAAFPIDYFVNALSSRDDG
jgi:RHS repeat-associated protein